MIFKRMNEIEGDFILKVKVSHDFKETYDSASVMVMVDDTHWAKCCYELTDFGTHAAVSVVILKAILPSFRYAELEIILRSTILQMV